MCIENISLNVCCLRSKIFPLNVLYTVRDLQIKETFVFGAQEAQERCKSMNDLGEVAVWYAMHPNVVVGPYHFNNETVQRVGYYQMLDSYLWSEAQQFIQKAEFQQDRSCLHFPSAVRSLLDAML